MQEQNKRKRVKGTYTPKYYSPYAYNRIKSKYPEYSINDIHKAIVMYFELAKEDLAMGRKINLLNKLGNLYLSKEQRSVEYNEETGEIKNNLPINIAESLKLWKQKPELKNKTFVRYVNDHSEGYLFRLHFETSKAVFKNKNIYNFQFNRSLKKELIENIYNKKVDSYLIKRKTDE